MQRGIVRPTSDKPYHHGDLPHALLAEAERILERDGIQALTLRAVARGVGVSHTAPRNHFGDMTGLLSELAAEGYRRFATDLTQTVEAAGPDPRTRLHAMGRGYVGFAADHPGLFTLMFRGEQLDSLRPALRDAVAQSRAALRQAVAARTGADPAIPSLVQAARATAAWSVVHGFATLMLDGRLEGILASTPGTDTDALFAAAMDSITFTGVD